MTYIGGVRFDRRAALSAADQREVDKRFMVRQRDLQAMVALPKRSREHSW